MMLHRCLSGFRMPHIELPRPLENYFAFAELERTPEGRRFSITLPYMEGQRLDSLQWWWRISPVQEKLIGEAGVARLRREATDRFHRHVVRWLENTAQRLTGDGPFPSLETLACLTPEAPEEATPDSDELPSTVVRLHQRATGTG